MPVTDVAAAPVPDIRYRLDRLEDKVVFLHDRDAQMMTEIAVMKTDLNHIRTTQTDLKSGINRVLWTVGLGFLTILTSVVFQPFVEVFQ